MGEIVLIPGGKEEFLDFTNASTKSDRWMHSYKDYECYRNMLGDENLKFMVAKTKSGEYVGSCMCFVFPEYAFVATYYVRPEFRSRGIGAQLFSLVINDELRKNNIGLHAAPTMAVIYQEKLGFNVKVPWMAYKFNVTNIKFPELSRLLSNFTVKDVKEVGLKRLVEYDTKINKTDRKSFVQSWVYGRSDAVSKVVLNSDGEIVGYGSARLLSIWDYPAFCPIYCDNDLVFGAIFGALAIHFKDQIERKNVVDMRVPTSTMKAVKMILEGIANTKVGTENVPLFTKFVPDHDINKIYSVSDTNMFI